MLLFFLFTPFALVLLLLPKQINLLLYEILARLKAALFRLYNELQMQTRYEKSVKEKNLLYLLFNDVRLSFPSSADFFSSFIYSSMFFFSLHSLSL
jgi:hypothetical protein